MRRMILMVLGVAVATVAATAAEPLVFTRQHVSTSTFEACSVCDVNQDGHLDVVSGGYWYEGPSMTQRHRITDVASAGEYWDDFSDYPMDVNGDGYPDIVTGGYWGGSLRWLENPKGQPVDWPAHVIGETGAIERCVFHDMDGDGVVEAIPTTAPVRIFRLVRDAEGRGAGRFEEFVVKEPGGGGHGLGAGDVNGDGRPDLIFCNGWFEAPANPFGPGWVWHPEFDLKTTSHPMLPYDVNRDGLIDIIFGYAHPYGLSWLEQGKGADGARTWTERPIDPDRSQYHDMQLVDIDNDGQVELVTGKRYRAHNGHDPGADDPIGLYYFKIDGGKFRRVTLDYGDPKAHSGAGIFLWVEDIDGNGWKDVVAPGKQGLYVFWNQGPLR